MDALFAQVSIDGIPENEARLNTSGIVCGQVLILADDVAGIEDIGGLALQVAAPN